MIVTVDLGLRSYEIVIGRHLLQETGSRLQNLVKGRQAFIVTDDNVGPLYAETVRASLEAFGFQTQVFTVAAGENSKSWQTAEAILTALLQGGFHRDCVVIALGGGVVGDLAGFCAAVYQRGVDFVQIPTSLLAQVDSSVGGKVAVNHPLGKNMIGAFYQPKAVLADLDTLATLPSSHWANGMAEVIKYGVIADETFFTWLEENTAVLADRQSAQTEAMIARCCQLKAQIVAQDEREKGNRAKLNFGHTIGHGLEIASHFGLLHGEAVAIGMVLAAELAVRQNRCAADVPQKIAHLLQKCHLPTDYPPEISTQAVLDGMALDKKVTDGAWVMILPQAIGQTEVVKGIAPKAVRTLLEARTT